MTVHVHRSVTGVAAGDHSHHAPRHMNDEERTWSFTCRPACEAQVLKGASFVASHPGAVPNTPDEDVAAQRLDEMSRRDVSKLALALGQLADRR